MKRIIIGLITLMVAVSVHAAAVNWTVAGLPTGGGTVTSMTAYLLDAADISLSDMTSKLDSGDFSALVNAKSSGNPNANGLVNISSATTVTKTDDNAGKVTYYTILVNGEKSLYLASDAIEYEIPGNGNITARFAPLTGKSWQSTSGGDIPEPTSGLLLIVGGALLALRRKQK